MKTQTINRLGNLLDILGCLDDRHHIIVHSLDANSVRAEIEAERFKVSEVRPDGFAAVQDATARDRLIGRA